MIDSPLNRLISIRLTCSGVRSRFWRGRGGGVMGRVLGPASDILLDVCVLRCPILEIVGVSSVVYDNGS